MVATAAFAIACGGDPSSAPAAAEDSDTGEVDTSNDAGNEQDGREATDDPTRGSDPIPVTASPPDPTHPAGTPAPAAVEAMTEVAVERPDERSMPSDLRMEWLPAGDLSAHDTRRIPEERDFQSPIVLHDVDADGDLDVIVGGSTVAGGDPACVYRNVSTPGDVRFERVDEWCLDGIEATRIGLVTWAPDGAVRLLVNHIIVLSTITLTDSGYEATAYEPLEHLPFACSPNVMASFDIDMDGTLELIGSCLKGQGIRPGFGWDVTGDPPLVVSDWGPLDFDEPTRTLSTAVVDANGDGLLDLVTAVDTLSTPRARNTFTRPGGVNIRCAPDEPCDWRHADWLDDPASWGSYMGAAVLEVDDQEYVYLTDYGPNRLFPLDPSEQVDRAAELAVDMDDGDTTYHTEWGVVPGDFDGDGDDDLFGASGALREFEIPLALQHQSQLLLQQDDGSFVALGAEAGILPPSVYRDHAGYPRSHRGAWRADLDGDGSLEILVGVMNGAPDVFRIVGDDTQAWCTLRPEGRYVPTFGFGDHVRRPDGRIVRHRVQGQFSLYAAESLVTRERSGHVVFASGAEVPFECEPGETVDVIEPEWITTEPGEGTHMHVTLHADGGRPAGTPVRIWLENPDAEPISIQGAIGEAILLPSDAGARWLVQVDGRWVGRWFVRDT